MAQFPSLCDAVPRSRSGQQDTRQSGMVSVGRICDTGEEGLLTATGPLMSPGVCGRVAAGAAPLVPSVPGRGGAAARTPKFLSLVPAGAPCPSAPAAPHLPAARCRRRWREAPEWPRRPCGRSGVLGVPVPIPAQT